MSEPIHLTNLEQLSIDSLQAEIGRMAELVSGIARETGLQAVTATLSLAGNSDLATPDRVRDIAHDLLSRAEIMEAEIGRFLSLAENAPLAEPKLRGTN